MKKNFFFNVILPLVLGLTILFFYQRKTVKAEEIGIGSDNSVYTPRLNHYPIHITYFGFADSLINGWEKRGSKEVVLWLGNSQLHTINQYTSGQQNCVQYLYDSLQKIDKTVLGISYPNANLQEFLFTIIYITQRCPKVKEVLLPVFYDDMREDQIRDDIANPNAVKWITQSKDSAYIADISSITHLKNNAPEALEANKDMKALDATAQEKSEKYLDSLARSNWKTWRNRPNLRAALFNDLHKFRNYILGIKANTKRKMIPGVFKENYHALLDILNYCNKNNIQLLLYIPPLRNDVEPPYDMNAYNAFKKDVEKDAGTKHARFVNLENLVPAKYWGQKGSTSGSGVEIDFMHFQSTGHKLLADTMYKLCEK